MLKLFSTGVIGTVLVGSLGIDIYSHIDSKNIEDIEKDKFAFGWFVSTIVLAIIIMIIGMVLTVIVPYVSPSSGEYGWIWAVVLNGLSVISSSFAWDLSTRTKMNQEEFPYRDRKIFIILTILFIITLFLSIRKIPFVVPM